MHNSRLAGPCSCCGGPIPPTVHGPVGVYCPSCNCRGNGRHPDGQPCRRKKNGPRPLCQVCETPLPWRKGIKKLCGDDDCRKAWARRREEASKPPKAQVPCGECGSLFLPYKRGDRQRFCSVACQSVSNARKQDYHNRARKAAVRAGDDISLGYLLERDQGRCWICRRPVKAGARVPDRMAPTFDHIVPLSDGGTHRRENVRLAHFSCNASRGRRGAAQTFLFG